MKLFIVAAMALMSINAFANVTIKPDTIKLYNEPNHVVSKTCDLYTLLTLDYEAGTISLENRVESEGCEIFAVPQKRVYEMAERADRDGCGSVVYAGPVKTANTNEASVRYVDNSSRVCDDVFVSMFVVTETNTAGETRTFYGSNFLR